MKPIFNKLLKTLLVLIITIIIVYSILTITSLCSWCAENQISLFFNPNESLLYLDSEKIEVLGNSISNYAQLLEDSLNKLYYETDSNYHSIAEYYDPLGFSVWSYIQTGIAEALTKYFNISILFGISIAITYIIITSKKISIILKIALGYFGVILVVPQLLFLSHFHRFFGIFKAYFGTPYIEYFYIGYTIIFVLMYIINYKISIKMTKELNQSIKNIS